MKFTSKKLKKNKKKSSTGKRAFKTALIGGAVGAVGVGVKKALGRGDQ